MKSSLTGKNRSERLDAVFHALSDRTRRSMLARLGRGPAIIRELADPFAMSLPAVCKHLRVLEAAGLVSRSVDGRAHRCVLKAAPLRTAEQWLDCYRPFWTQTLDALADFAEDGSGAGRSRPR